MAAYELKSGITAICPATINPARALGIEKAHGQITEGALSNLLILDQDLNIKDIIFEGQVLSL
ncbi:amidohydrolase family protein [Suilimivivens sp.]|uniref:amidohydrolase family protein n=1 Tax=Suilimivivens sp. TaxID=2981669 RepID=UPI00307AB414